MTQQVHNTVFISYRRSTSSYLARAIYMDLKAHGYDVFMDVQSIDSGQFDAIILRQIEARAHFLLLCTPGTFDRINDPGDWLRREIEHAMLHNRNIVPIMASDFKFEAATTQRFTGKLAELPRYNALNAPHDFFEEALERLRTRFLKLPVWVSITATPAADVQAVAAKQADVESKSKPTQKQLTARELFNRGFVAYENADFDSAIASYTAAISVAPRYAEAYNNRGLARYQKQEYGAAISDYTRAIELNNPELHLSYNNRGLARFDKGDVEEAIVDYTEAIRLNPKFAEAYYNRGTAHNTQQVYDDAIADYNEAIRLDPEYAIAYFFRGNVHFGKRDYSKAIEDYSEKIRLTPQDADAYHNRALAKESKGDRNGAIADYSETIRLEPAYANAYFGRGNMRKQTGDYRLAMADLLHYVELTRINPNPHWLAESEKHIRELKKKLRIK